MYIYIYIHIWDRLKIGHPTFTHIHQCTHVFSEPCCPLVIKHGNGTAPVDRYGFPRIFVDLRFPIAMLGDRAAHRIYLWEPPHPNFSSTLDTSNCRVIGCILICWGSNPRGPSGSFIATLGQINMAMNIAHSLRWRTD